MEEEREKKRQVKMKKERERFPPEKGLSKG